MPKPVSDLLDCLTQKQRQKFQQKIVEGTGTATLCKMLQEQFGVHGDVSMHNLSRRVTRYVKTYMKQTAIEKQITAVTPEQVQTYIENYNALERLTALCKIQDARITKALKKEDKVEDLVMKMVSDEIKIASTLLKDLADVQMKAGVITLAPKVYPQTVQQGEDAPRDTITIPITPELRKAMETLETLQSQVNGDTNQ